MTKFKRIAALALAVAAILALGSCQKKDETAPEGFKLANESGDFYFYVPSAWTVDAKEGSVVASSPNDRASISVMTWNKIDATPKDVWESYVKGFETAYKDFKEQSREDIKLDGADARSVVYNGTLGEGEEASEFCFRQVIAVKGTLVFALTYANLADGFDGHTSDFDAVISYFKFK